MTSPNGAWASTKAWAAKLAVADGAAAEIAFYLAMSLVPLVGVGIALAGRVLPLDLGVSIESVLGSVLPVESHVGAGDVMLWARSSASEGWLTIGFVVALWTSFRFMAQCVRSLTTVVSTDVRVPENAWRSAARALLLLAVWIATLVATALLLFVKPALERGLLRFPWLPDASSWALSAVRAVLIGGVLFGAIYMTYWAVVGEHTSRRRLLLASLLAALGWIGASRGFSLAVPVLWHATQLYGTLGSVVLFLVWAYVMAWVFLLGGFLFVPPDAVEPTVERESVAV